MDAAIKHEAEMVHGSLDKEVGSIIAILMIISIIISVMRLLQNCQKDAKYLKGISGRKMSRYRISKSVANEMGLVLYKEHGEKVVDAIMKRNGQITTEHLQNLLGVQLDN